MLKIISITIALCLAVFATATTFVSQLNISNKRLSKAGDSEVYRVVDKETGVVCYVVPKEFCNGSCAYSPAISCIMHGNLE